MTLMPYDDMHAQVLRSLERARALDTLGPLVADLYADEINEAKRGLHALVVYYDRPATGGISRDVMAEINRRYDAVWRLPSEGVAS